MPPAPASLLSRITARKSRRLYSRGESVFSQGDAADAVFYVERGKVALTVASTRGKEALVGSLGRGTFFGEGCLARQPLRMSSARTLKASTILRVDRQAMAALLHRAPKLRQLFIAHLLSRSIRIEKDLIAQLFNSSEKRLARALLLLARFGRTSKPEMVMPKMTQEALAARVGAARSKVGYFMKRFRKLGFIDYAGGEVRVHRGLLSVLLSD
jgi:CRP/FNR family transcriptional regulator, cyclic AMP receptor protein